MSTWRSGMFWQFFIASGGILLLAVVTLGVAVLNRTEANEWARAHNRLESRARLIQEVARGYPPEKLPELAGRLNALAAEEGLRVTLLDQNGRPWAERRPGGSVAETAIAPPDPPDPGDGKWLIRQDGGEQVERVMLMNPDLSAPVAAVWVDMPLAQVQPDIAALRLQVWATVGLISLLGVLLAFWFTRRILRPLHELAVGAEQIAAGDYGRKVFAEGYNEVGMLARSFNHTSERLAAQFAQLDADRQQLRAVLSSMVEGVVAVDADQNILVANERAGQLLEFETRTAVGRKLWEVVRHRAIQETVHSAVADGKGHQNELTWNGPTARSLLVNANPLPGSPPRGAVLVLHETTELRRLERLRQEFVANVSHELKTPLTVIKASAETLADGAAADPAHRETFLGQITCHADRLGALIHDLISLARIESGSETFVFESVPVAKVVDLCVSRRRNLALARSQSLGVVPPADPVAAWVDEEALLQILDNLADNAIKYTPEGGRILIRWWPESDSVFLEVEDTGLGIPQDQLPRIFERFYRVDKARSRELGGTGLGLSIVKHLVQAMQGSVQAKSQVGHGSTFTVRLRRRPS